MTAEPSTLRTDSTHTVDGVRSALEPLLAEPEGPAERGPPTLVVALSGGLDSVVLLHALRFPVGLDVPLVAAHFDHGMRPGSACDAAWVRGLCRAWEVELVMGAASERPTSEDEARKARYTFLERVANACDRPIVLTAHHADDQAETVLFRALRGTGIEGLAGIPRLRTLDGSTPTSDSGPPLVARPLFDVWREELEAYAVDHSLAWRDDPTNEHLGYARNVLRHEILPMAEEKVAPGARRALARLAEIAGDEDAAWKSAMRLILDAIDASTSPPPSDGAPAPPRDDASAGARAAAARAAAARASCDRNALLALGPELAARVVRHLVASVGRRLDADATRRAVDFVRDSQSGRRIELGGGVELALESDRVVIDR